MGTQIRDRAVIIANTILQIIRRILLDWLHHGRADMASSRAEIEDILRDEYLDIERQAAADRIECDPAQSDLFGADPFDEVEFDRQLDLFDAPPDPSPPTWIALTPCGRGLGACRGIAEHGQIKCVTSGCSGRYPRASPNDTPASTIFDGFIRSQQSQLEFLRKQASPPGDTGNS
jgi:hypothetical protein